MTPLEYFLATNLYMSTECAAEISWYDPIYEVDDSDWTYFNPQYDEGHGIRVYSLNGVKVAIQWADGDEEEYTYTEMGVQFFKERAKNIIEMLLNDIQSDAI